MFVQCIHLSLSGCFSVAHAVILAVIRAVPVVRADLAVLSAAKAANFEEAFCIGTASVPAAMASNTIAHDPNAKVAHAV